MRDLRDISKNNHKRKPEQPKLPVTDDEPVEEEAEEEVEEETEDEDTEEASESDTHNYSYHSNDEDSGFSFTSIITAIIIIGLMIVLVFTAFSIESNGDAGLGNIFPTPAPTPVITTGTYVGTLTSINCDQNDYSGTITATHINFADGNSFQIEGFANYAIGLQYKVTFQYYISGNGDTVITHTDDVQLISNGGD